MKTIDKLLLLKLLSRVWLSGATTSCKLTIAQDDFTIEADHRAAFVFQGSDLILRILMVEDASSPDILSVGSWNLPKLSAALKNFEEKGMI